MANGEAGGVGGVGRAAFRYRDKGSLATIGRARAVALIKGRHLAGLIAWLLWAVVHVLFLIGFRNRVVVMATWVWNWLFFSRDARLITGDSRMSIHTPRPGDLVLTREDEGTAEGAGWAERAEPAGRIAGRSAG